MELPAIPGYEPVRALGIACGGPFGAKIYLARRLNGGDLVAMRVDDAWCPERARHDTLVARLDHPNILRIFEIGDFQGRSYCAREYVEEDLAERLRQGPLSQAHALKFVTGIALAVQYAWNQGMVSENLIPNGILLAIESVPKLFAFEPLQSVRERRVFGSAEFLAPEEVKGIATTSITTLVYRVGAVMYAVLTGQPPFERSGGTAGTLVRVLKEAPVPPHRVNATVDRDLEAVCMKCLEKRPEDRYASLQELAERVAALEQVADLESPTRRPWWKVW